VRSNLRARPALLILLSVVALYGGVAAWQRAHRPGGRVVGRTHCSWVGAPRIELTPGLARTESIATVAHESVHVASCNALGPVRYRWNTLFAASNLALEAPAYCAAARVRLKSGWTINTVKTSVITDMQSAMGDQLDSVTLHRAVVAYCPELK
jgi:hypothetical protein